MKSIQCVKCLLVAAAVVSMAINSSPAMANGLVRSSGSGANLSVKDVSLATGGVFRGHVVAADGQPIAGAAVVLQQDTRRVAETVSDENGGFAFQGVAGGTYLVSTDGAVAAYRLWAAQTAPPASQPAAMLVKSSEIVRGQIGGTGVSGVVITTVVVGLVTWGIVEIVDNESSS